jgi:uncharacterized protein YdeI (YjbR/CyaY-like superfamily)
MKTLQAKSRNEWRDWLIKHHATEKEIWLVYYKMHTGKTTIKYRESVEEAICFGWIDGIKKRIDEEKYTHRFTIRRSKSKWSKLNIGLAKKMIAEKRMTRFGLVDSIKSRAPISNKLTPELAQILMNNKSAWNNFLNLAPSHKKQYVRWIMSAKKETTKQKRLAQAIRFLEQNKKIGMK